MRLFGRGVGGFAPSSIVRYCFFFSSRRRHTRCSRDWSSDVCSSDLQFGKKIAIHSYGPAGARDAVRAGTDSLEHATDMDDATIAEMAKHGTFYVPTDRKSTRLNSSHGYISYAVFCLKKKKRTECPDV